VTNLFQAIAGFLAAILLGWLQAILSIVRRLQGEVANWSAQSRLPGRAARGSDSNCNPVRHPSYRKPDPLIYDQYFLMSLGLAVTWDNPDIELRRGGVTVSSSDVLPDTEYDIVARVWNGSTDAPVVKLPVYFSYLEFGIGITSHPIDNDVPTYVDLGVKGGVNCPAFATKRWRTPPVPGHYCLQVFLDWLDDANPLNNLGQENLAIGVAHSAAQFTFMLRNDDTERRGFRFEVDAYRPPKPRPCDEVQPPTVADRRNLAVQPARYRLIPVLDPAVRARHDPAAYPLGEDWHVEFDPAEPVLDPSEERHIRVAVTPPTGFVGTTPINVRALHGTTSIGGVTLVVTQG
jgi:hypothetical protein